MKVVIEEIPTYSMMTYLLLAECIKEIHKFQRNFIWGDSEDQSHIHAVKWNSLIQPKAFGSLELRGLRHMNKACLEKLG